MRGVIAAAVVALWTLIYVSNAGACSCAPQAPSESLREADAAIVGRLVEVAPLGRFRAEYRYEVGAVYRGRRLIELGQELEVRSARRASACALPRRLGKRYGLFLVHRGDLWAGGICGVVSPQRMRHAATQRASARARAGCR